MKRLVVLSFFPAFAPPKSGGELRLFHLYRELSQRFRIDLVSWTYPDRPEEQVVLAPWFTDHRIPKTPDFEEAYFCFARRGITGEVSGVACAMAGRGETRYHAVAARLIAEADAVIHEFPYTLPYDRTIGRDGKPRIYNAHNVEADMARALTDCRDIHDLVLSLERRLARESALVLAVSEAERLKFHLIHGVPLDRIGLCPNGVSQADFAWARAMGRDRPKGMPLKALFFGSDHPPNVAAARYIVQVLAPSFPATDFIIAGSVTSALGAAVGSNVACLAVQDDRAKRALFEAADLFLNPISQGAGTSLKVLEAMAAGLPVLTTEAGIRGLDLTDGVEAVIAPLDRFPSRLLTLLARPASRASLGATAGEMVAGRFSWGQIAEGLATALDRVLAEPGEPESARSLVLWVNDYSVADAISGGQVRIRRLMRAAALDHEIVLLCLGPASVVEIEALEPHCHEIRVPRSEEQRQVTSLVNAGNAISADDIVASLCCARNADFVTWFQWLQRRAVGIVFAHPYLLPVLEHAGKERPVILDMHNVESDLKAGLLGAHRDAETLLPLVEATEDYGWRVADHVVTVTDADARRGGEIYGHRTVSLIPNGVDPCPAYLVLAAFGPRAARDWRQGFTAVFVGSAHPPNIEAARFLCRQTVQAVPEMRLVIIGAVGAALGEDAVHERIVLAGVVTPERKQALLLEADVALNPMTGGGGSSLKIADYLAHGLPLVSTSYGARGFPLTDGLDCVLADGAAFPEALGRLGADPNLRDAIARRGYDLAVARFGWDGIAGAFARLLPRPAASRRTRRLLVVTYRFTEPALGGAEDYLAKLLASLGGEDGFEIDLWAPSVEGLRNESRFITTAEPRGISSARAIAPYLRNLVLFPPDKPDRTADEAACWRLFRRWQDETLALGRQVASLAAGPLLLGGWTAAERDEAGPYRWSTGNAEILVPEGQIRLTLRGRIDGDRATLIHRWDDGEWSAATVGRNFTLHLPLDGTKARILGLAMEAHPSPHGVLIEIAFALTQAVLVDAEGAETVIDLGQDYESVAQRHRPEDWVRWSVETALARDPEADADFARLRGPHATSLLAALKEKAHEYDVALIQGVPFSLAAEAGQIAADCLLPYVVLPHLHVEDRFYHWRCFYRLFGEARSVLTFSAGLAASVIARSGGRALAIPGGGIDPSEFTFRSAGERGFRVAHRGGNPYFLVLGRKSGSKRIDLVVDAWRRLRRERSIDLVVIGPDEGVFLPVLPGLYNYAFMPRALVIGALSGACSLVSMSESESFGMVLLEAWMCERPVIANSGTLAFAELVSDGTDGILVEDAASLEEAMRRLADDADLAGVMGRNGRAKAGTYTWASTARILADALIEAAS
jgi:glycosyltransferase involved in cell wall biosynthesis